MYAVIQTGGKQYKVQSGDTIYVEKLAGNAGDPVEFAEVLLVSTDTQVAVGRPLVEGAKVTGQIVEQDRGDKVLIFKFRRRKNYRKKAGHRQPYTAVRISEVVAPTA